MLQYFIIFGKCKKLVILAEIQLMRNIFIKFDLIYFAYESSSPLMERWVGIQYVKWNFAYKYTMVFNRCCSKCIIYFFFLKLWFLKMVELYNHSFEMFDGHSNFIYKKYIWLLCQRLDNCTPIRSIIIRATLLFIAR